MAKIPIYMISQRYPPDPLASGSGYHTYYLVEELLKQNYDVKVISVTKSDKVFRTINLDFLQRFYLIPTMFLYAIISALTISKTSRGNNIIVHTQGSMDHLVGVVLKLLYPKRISFIMTQHGPGINFVHEALDSIKGAKSIKSILNGFRILFFYLFGWYFIEKLAYKFSDKIICVNDFMKLDLARDGIKEKKLVKIDNAIPKKKESVTPSSENYFLFMGGDQIIKGFDILLKAYNAYKENGGQKLLYIAGKAKAKVFNHIKMLGPVQGKLKDQLYRNCYATIIPSRYESGPIVALEALSFNKPVVLSKYAGLSYYVKKNRFGYVTELDPNQIAQLMLKMENIEIYKTFQSNIQLKFNLFWENIINKYITLYNSPF